MKALHPEELVGAYECLRRCAPFRAWALPASDSIEFIVRRIPQTEAQIISGISDPEYHAIAINPDYHGHLVTLLSTMAHEMIHLHQRRNGLETRAMHNADFKRRAARVCKELGFDLKQFMGA